MRLLFPVTLCHRNGGAHDLKGICYFIQYIFPGNHIPILAEYNFTMLLLYFSSYACSNFLDAEVLLKFCGKIVSLFICSFEQAQLEKHNITRKVKVQYWKVVYH